MGAVRTTLRDHRIVIQCWLSSSRCQTLLEPIMDDWQDVVFSTRHYHNRLGKGGGTGGHRYGSQFDVKRVFGRYDVECNAARDVRRHQGVENGDRTAYLDVLRFDRENTGLLGRLLIPDVIDADVILAGNRKTLQALVTDHTPAEGDEGSHHKSEQKEGSPFKEGFEREQEQCSDRRPSVSWNLGLELNTSTGERTPAEGIDQDGTSDHDGSMEGSNDDEARIIKRHDNFEKNSFRTPKFWFQWTGQVRPSTIAPSFHTGRGYLVFSGKNCKIVKGTITADCLQWNDVPLSGRKRASMPERDDPLCWLREAAS